jgi:hypothetical protein
MRIFDMDSDEKAEWLKRIARVRRRHARDGELALVCAGLERALDHPEAVHAVAGCPVCRQRRNAKAESQARRRRKKQAEALRKACAQFAAKAAA